MGARKPVGGGGARNPNSLANLRRGGNDGPVPNARSWQPGEAPRLGLGDRTRRPQRSPEWPPAVEAAIADLTERVGAELRAEDGELHPWALPSVEAVAIQRVAAWRAERFVADREARGALTIDDLDRASKVGERFHKALEREALTLRSRIEARTASFDLATHWAGREEASDG